MVKMVLEDELTELGEFQKAPRQFPIIPFPAGCRGPACHGACPALKPGRAATLFLPS